MARKLKQSTPDHLIQVAQQLFAEFGYSATTVQDIAKKAKVNVSLVSYYFKGKEGLFRTCVEKVASTRLEVARSILVKPASLDEFKVRLQVFTDEMLKYHAENPDVCAILHRDLHTEMNLLGDIFERTLLVAFKTFVAFVEEAKDQKFVASWVDPLLTAGMYYGILFHMAKNQDISKKYFGKSLSNEQYRVEVRDYLIKTTLEGILK